jgi:hypothetical protein
MAANACFLGATNNSGKVSKAQLAQIDTISYCSAWPHGGGGLGASAVMTDRHVRDAPGVADEEESQQRPRHLEEDE